MIGDNQLKLSRTVDNLLLLPVRVFAAKVERLRRLQGVWKRETEQAERGTGTTFIKYFY